MILCMVYDSRCMHRACSSQPVFGAYLSRIENMHHLHITSMHVLPRNKCFHAKQNLISPALKLVLATEHTNWQKHCPSPSPTHICMLIRKPRVCALANTYSQTGEAPWLSRVSVSMSVLMVVADLKHAHLTDRELLYTSLPPSCPSLIFNPLSPSPSHWMVKRCIIYSGDRVSSPFSHHFLQLHY